jgi:hypothetical protein
MRGGRLGSGEIALNRSSARLPEGSSGRPQARGLLHLPSPGCVLRRGSSFNPESGNVVTISGGVDYDLEWDLENWRWLHPTSPSRSRAIRILLRKGLAADEKEREEASKSDR